MKKVLPLLVAALLFAFPSNVDARQKARNYKSLGIWGPDSIEGWAQDRINQPWDKLDGKTLAGSDYGSGYTVYLIDSGTGAEDCNGHGTMMKSIINGSKYGIAGSARVVSLKVLGCDGYGSAADIINALNWVEQNANLDQSIINMSLGGPPNDELDNVVNRLGRKIPIVVAAGNESQYACNRSPARASSAITVASINPYHLRSLFSNYGKCVDIWAPGDNIDTTDGSDQRLTVSGTSPSAALVSASIAIIADRDNSTTYDAALTILRESSDMMVVDGRCLGVKPSILWVREEPYPWIRISYPSSLR